MILGWKYIWIRLKLRFFEMLVLFVDMSIGRIVGRKSILHLSISTLVSYLHQELSLPYRLIRYLLVIILLLFYLRFLIPWAILCYASQIWGYEYLDTIETIYNKFCKSILYVCNTCMVLGECGRLPLCTTYYINCIRYWCNLLTMPSHRHPKQCYNMLKSIDDAGRNCWATKVRKRLKNI